MAGWCFLRCATFLCINSAFIHLHVILCVAPQACHIEGGSAGLIPSQLLEEKRKAFVKKDSELATAGTQTRRRQRQRLLSSPTSRKHFLSSSPLSAPLPRQ